MHVVFSVLEPLIFNFLWIHISEFWIYLILCEKKTFGFLFLFKFFLEFYVGVYFGLYGFMLVSCTLFLYSICCINRELILQNQQLLDSLRPPKEMVQTASSTVLLHTARRTLLLKDICGYTSSENFYIIKWCDYSYADCQFATNIVFRQQPQRSKLFQFLVEIKILCFVHKKDSCGGLHLYLLHNLAIRLLVLVIQNYC